MNVTFSIHDSQLLAQRNTEAIKGATWVTPAHPRTTTHTLTHTTINTNTLREDTHKLRGDTHTHTEDTHTQRLCVVVQILVGRLKENLEKMTEERDQRVAAECRERDQNKRLQRQSRDMKEEMGELAKKESEASRKKHELVRLDQGQGSGVRDQQGPLQPPGGGGECVCVCV